MKKMLLMLVLPIYWCIVVMFVSGCSNNKTVEFSTDDSSPDMIMYLQTNQKLVTVFARYGKTALVTKNMTESDSAETYTIWNNVNDDPSYYTVIEKKNTPMIILGKNRDKLEELVKKIASEKESSK